MKVEKGMKPLLVNAPMARTFARVADVEAEYLHDIGDDYRAEGFETLEDFIATWDKVAPWGYKWDDSPIVWVYRFEVIK